MEVIKHITNYDPDALEEELSDSWTRYFESPDFKRLSIHQERVSLLSHLPLVFICTAGIFLVIGTFAGRAILLIGITIVGLAFVSLIFASLRCNNPDTAASQMDRLYDSFFSPPAQYHSVVAGGKVLACYGEPVGDDSFKIHIIAETDYVLSKKDIVFPFKEIDADGELTLDVGGNLIVRKKEMIS